jgi:hypothetical protein
MTAIVTLEQTVPALSIDLVASTSGEISTLRSAMLTSGLNGGGLIPIADGIVLLTSGAEALLAQFTVPTTGYIAVTVTAGANPTSTAPITTAITGGVVVNLVVNSTSVSAGLMNGCQVPNGVNNGLPLTLNCGHQYLHVTAGDIVKAYGSVLMNPPPSNYVTVSPVGSSTRNSLNWHYVA